MKKRGISLLLLATTIVVMTILITTTIVGISLATDDAKLITFKSELDEIESKLKETYSLTGILPVKGSVKTLEQVLVLVNTSERAMLLKEIELNKDDTNRFYQVDLNQLKVTKTKRGIEDTQDDIYVFSEKTLKVYYVKGLNVGGNRYFSLTSELSDLSNVTGDADKEILELTQKLNVKKKQNTWSNKIDIEVTTALGSSDVVKLIFPNSTTIDVTDSVKKGNVEISLSTCSEVNLRNAKKVTLAKYENQSSGVKLIDQVDIDISNMDYIAPVIELSDFEIITTATGKRLSLKNVVDNESGIVNIRYQQVSKKENNQIIRVTDASINDAINAVGSQRTEIEQYLKTFSKIAQNNQINLIDNIYHVRVIVEDRAGNFSNYLDYIIE